MRIVTFGTFDHLHQGHLQYLRFAQSKGQLFVVVARDANVERIKGRRPDLPEQERLTALQQAFKDADVRLGDMHDYRQPINDIAPDLIVLGYDQQLPPNLKESDLPCPIERAEPFEPETYKSSLMRKKPTTLG